MSELCTPVAERARKARRAVLAALQEPGSQVAIAAALGTSESTISRLKNERLGEVLAFLYAAGFKVVRQGVVSITPESFESLRQIAAKSLADPARARWVMDGME